MCVIALETRWHDYFTNGRREVRTDSIFFEYFRVALLIEVAFKIIHNGIKAPCVSFQKRAKKNALVL